LIVSGLIFGRAAGLENMGRFVAVRWIGAYLNYQIQGCGERLTHLVRELRIGFFQTGTPHNIDYLIIHKIVPQAGFARHERCLDKNNPKSTARRSLSTHYAGDHALAG